MAAREDQVVEEQPGEQHIGPFGAHELSFSSKICKRAQDRARLAETGRYPSRIEHGNDQLFLGTSGVRPGGRVMDTTVARVPVPGKAETA